ncbi:LysM peptidoglycan-binding domain-containing protein [Arthrobacter sp. BL-252-APC-1A]|uniref:LysM peptidoglycan-binding domain-containing protein n=1 Tax=Arthrobacter sp. BL-252-APC-1A TaxID=2606622 RepID=UPI0012B35704|nr:LysM peptidoglycan-binding domain-containing protein [Arthrobacter sp. BL-252-APC-1A]MSR97469.1 LysM peptidoglycan-binding domain-containing protein [Arthrobacter sp. BL-252-APC-1A]
MSSKNRGRHCAESSIWTTIAKAAPGKARTVTGTAAAVVAGSGLMFGMAAPAQAGVVANDTAAPAAAASFVAPVAETVAAPAAETAAPAAATTHTVVSGDTLGEIAAAYGVSLDSVFALNGLGMESIIYPGDVITVSGEAAAAPAPAAYTAPVETYTAPVEAAAPAAAYTDPGTYTDYSNVTTQAAVPAAAPAAASGTGAIMLSSAYAQLGAMQDCTILVEQALRAAGHSVGDLAPAQLAAYGTPVSNPQPGDMIYYANGGAGVPHIAIYIGDGQAIHSGMNGNQTVIATANLGSGPVYYRA